MCFNIKHAVLYLTQNFMMNYKKIPSKMYNHLVQQITQQKVELKVQQKVE